MSKSLSVHFSRIEFACSCGCGFDTVDVELLKILENVREHFSKPVAIVSGCRCERRNAVVGGAASSQHLKGRAADIKVMDTEPYIVWLYLINKYPEELGIGLYKTFVHVDTRSGRKARWNGLD